MLSLKRLFRWGSTYKGPTTEPACSCVPVDHLQLLAVTRSEHDAAALHGIAVGEGWSVAVVSSSTEAVDFLSRRPAPVVICDGDLPGEDWRQVISTIASQPRVVCVLLASRVVDEYLWDEVIKHRGYDVVTKPFKAEELRRAVTFAWSSEQWREQRGA